MLRGDRLDRSVIEALRVGSLRSGLKTPAIIRPAAWL